MLIDHFKEHSQAIAAQRQSAKVTYCLFEALFGSLCTVIADAKGWFDIREYIPSPLIGLSVMASLCAVFLLMTLLFT